MFNFFEPLHYFQHDEGFQTWELSPQFAIRSWSYVLLHWPLAAGIPKILSLGKVSYIGRDLQQADNVETTVLCFADVPRFHLGFVRG